MSPCRPLFLSGWLFALLGVAPWVLLPFGRAPVSPHLVHPDLMVGGFLWSFAAGFLMTALPRYLGSFVARWWEVAGAVALSVAKLLTAFGADRGLWHALWLAELVWVALFGLRRVRARRVWPPPVFSFVALGLGLGVAGVGALLAFDLGHAGPRVAVLGRTFAYYGMMPAFVLGVGSGLLTAMFGWKQASLIKLGKPGEAHLPWSARAWREPGALLVLFTLGLVCEPLGGATVGRALRAVCITWVAVRAWRIYRPARSPGRVVRWAWVSGLWMAAGAWLHVAGYPRAVDAAHALFILGLGLMALMVASRVVLVHGGRGVAAETRWRSISATGWLVSLAALGRVFAAWTGPAYLRHLAYAGMLWGLALLVWGAAFVPELLRPRRRGRTAAAPPR
ncbi:MAG: NnrS family protein [Planctomycetota bacterium]|nr:MAG: NnrS family protein [Planctomycetota bacterium]